MDLNLGYTQLIIQKAKARKVSLQRLAYILATAYHETAHTMKPVKEAFWLSEDWRKKNLRYYPWYGRGFVQLTWEANYKKASEKLGIDFIKDPEAVMKPEASAEILIVGMLEGWFTGKSVYDFIDDIDEPDQEELREFANARRVVNGVDKQIEIGKLAIQYESDLKRVGYNITLSSEPIVTVDVPRREPDEFVRTDTQTTTQSETSSKTLLSLLKLILEKVFK